VFLPVVAHLSKFRRIRMGVKKLFDDFNKKGPQILQDETDEI